VTEDQPGERRLDVARVDSCGSVWRFEFEDVASLEVSFLTVGFSEGLGGAI
jgi:hypothetical protein